MNEIEGRSESATSGTGGAVDFWSQVDQLFRDFQSGFYTTVRNPSFAAATYGHEAAPAPALADVADRGEQYEIQADLPGVSRDQIDVRVIGNAVQLQATPKSPTAGNGAAYLRRERNWSGYRRIIELPEPIRGEDIRARFEDGVLTVSVPKAHPVVERKVEVQ